MPSTAAERAREVFPAGSNGEFDLPPELSMVVERGAGARLWDTSGREYLDFSMGWGSVLVGHARPEIERAVVRQVRRGTNFAYPTAAALALAEAIRAASAACEQLRFCASGTEATMYCLRVARAATGRSRVLKFEGAYHGAHDTGVLSLFPRKPPRFPHAEPSSAGIAAATVGATLIAPFNDLDATRGIFAAHADDIAAVIVEPLQRCVPPQPGFLAGLRAECSRRGILLIFDEVVTGFRLAYGGAQEYYGVVPDLVAYGKALGGGLPLGAFGGRRELMTLVEEHRLGGERYVWTASTLGGNPLSCAAALAALEIYREETTYPLLHALGRYLRAGMTAILDACGITAQVVGDGPLAQVVFSPEPVSDYRSTQRGDAHLGRRVMLELFRNGIFLNPMGTKLYLSLAHDEEVCNRFLDRFEAALVARGHG